MKLSRIVLLLIVAAFAVAAAEADEDEAGEKLGEGEEFPEDDKDDDDDDDEGDEVREKPRFPEDDKDDDEGDFRPAVLSEVQIQNLLKKIDSDGNGKASLDEFKLFAKNSALLEAQNSFDEQHPAETFVVKTVDEHLEEIRKKYEGFDDEGMLELDRQKHLAADENKDGKLDKDEYFHIYAFGFSNSVLNIDAKHSFLQADVNKEGSIDLDEFLLYHLGNASVASVEEAAEPMSVGEAAEPINGEGEKRLFTALDKDGNGKLDLDEWTPFLTNHHQAAEIDSAILVESADSNKDGHLDLEELVKFIGDPKAEHPQSEMGRDLFNMWASTHKEL